MDNDIKELMRDSWDLFCSLLTNQNVDDSLKEQAGDLHEKIVQFYLDYLQFPD